MSPDRHLVLVGMMGVGKSSVGRRLARRLERPFLDTDRLVEERRGCSIHEIFTAQGEAAFRALEAAVVKEVLAAPSPAVIAFGGGAVLDPANRAAARAAALVVWLQATPVDLARRVSGSQRATGGTARPLLATGDPVAVLGDMLAGREAAYRDAAHHCVDTTGRSPGQVATAVIAAAGLTERSPARKQR